MITASLQKYIYPEFEKTKQIKLAKKNSVRHIALVQCSL